MQRGDVGMVLGIAGFLLGGWACFTSTSMKRRVETLENVSRQDEESITGMGARLQDVHESHKALAERVERLSTDPKAMWDAVHDMDARLKRLEHPAPPTPTFPLPK